MKKSIKTKQPSIAAAWNSYLEMVLPPTIAPGLRADLRLAFYGGAATLFYSILNALDEGEEPTDADLARMNAINDEIDQFAKTFDAEVLKRHGGMQ